jgi:ABC-type transport system substrate-binding protein
VAYVIAPLLGAVVVGVALFLLLRGDGDEGEACCIPPPFTPTVAAAAGTATPTPRVAAAATPASGASPAATHSPAAGGERSTIVLVFNASVRPLTDARVRQALAEASEGSGILWFDGRGVPLGAQVTSFDPAHAKRLLAEAGVKPADLGFTLLVNTSRPGRTALERLISDWKTHLNVEVKVEGLEQGAFFQRQTSAQYEVYVQSVQ